MGKCWRDAPWGSSRRAPLSLHRCIRTIASPRTLNSEKSGRLHQSQRVSCIDPIISHMCLLASISASWRIPISAPRSNFRRLLTPHYTTRRVSSFTLSIMGEKTSKQPLVWIDCEVSVFFFLLLGNIYYQ